MQGNQVATQQPKNAVKVFEAVIKGDFINDQLTGALKERKGAFVTSLIELYTGDRALQECNPKLVALEAVKAAALNLPINKALGFAYIVVYKNNVKSVDPQTGRDVWTKVPTPTFVLGYKGYIQLASRTGQYRAINATPVYEGELKSIDRLSGAIDLSGKRTSDKVIGYAGYIEYLNGFSKAEYMSVEDMAKHAMKYSPSMPKNMKISDLVNLANKEPEAKKVGWLGNFNDMAQKTIIRRIISKYGYMTIQSETSTMANALMYDSTKAITANERDEAIAAAEARHELISTEEVAYEEVEQGTKPAPAPAAAPAAPAAPKQEEDPGY